MKLKKRSVATPVATNWDEIELQVYSLRSPRLTPEEKLAKAKFLADIYRKAGKPLPDILAILA